MNIFYTILVSALMIISNMVCAEDRTFSITYDDNNPTEVTIHSKYDADNYIFNRRTKTENGWGASTVFTDDVNSGNTFSLSGSGIHEIWIETDDLWESNEWEQWVYIPHEKPDNYLELAKKYMPIVAFYENEYYYPQTLDAILEYGVDEDESKTKAITIEGAKTVKMGKPIKEFLTHNGNKGYWFNFERDDTTCDSSPRPPDDDSPPDCSPLFLRDSTGNPRDEQGNIIKKIPIYFHVSKEDENIYLSYYFFYAFDPKIGTPTNPATAAHAFDRESFTIILGLNEKPKSIIYAGHLPGQEMRFMGDSDSKSGSFLAQWNGGKVQLDWDKAQKLGTHPIIYKAQGSHAVFPSQGWYWVADFRVNEGNELYEPAGNLDGSNTFFPKNIDLVELGMKDQSYLAFSGFWVDVLGPLDARFPPFEGRTPQVWWAKGTNSTAFTEELRNKYFKNQGAGDFGAVRGRVVDELGNPLPGQSRYSDGTFTYILQSSLHNLDFSSPGYETLSKYFEVKAGEDGEFEEITLVKEGSTTNPPNQDITISSVSPLTVIIGEEIIFTVTGVNLTSGMGFSVADCESSSIEVGTGTSTQRQFTCEMQGSAGEKTGIVKDMPSGERLYPFTVQAEDAPPPTGGLLDNTCKQNKTDCINHIAYVTSAEGLTFWDMNDNWSTITLPQGTKFNIVGVYDDGQGTNTDDYRIEFNTYHNDGEVNQEYAGNIDGDGDEVDKWTVFSSSVSNDSMTVRTSTNANTRLYAHVESDAVTLNCYGDNAGCTELLSPKQFYVHTYLDSTTNPYATKDQGGCSDNRWALASYKGESPEFGQIAKIGYVCEIAFNDNTLSLPFEAGESWVVCQGYNTDPITHHPTGAGYTYVVDSNLSHSFDLSINTGAASGTHGCNGDNAASSGEEIIAPGTGRVTRIVSVDMICIGFDNENLGSMMLGHSANFNMRVGDTVIKDETVLGTLGTNTGTSGAYAHIHMGLYSDNACHTPIPFGTVFDNGMDYQNDGTNYQWYRELLTK